MNSPFMFPHQGGCRRCTAFTLFELLVVIAIIAILTVLVLPVWANASTTSKAHRIACANNFKQIGAALAMYTSEYNDTLCGGINQAGQAVGLEMGQKPGYDNTFNSQWRYLSYYLCTFMGMPAPSSNWQVIKAFVCPGLQAYGPIKGEVTNRVVFKLPSAGAYPPDPLNPGAGDATHPVPYYIFGYNDPKPNPFGGAYDRPKKLSWIKNYAPLNVVRAVGDVDWGNVSVQNSYRLDVPDKPVHGTVRNYLYLDGHVGTVTAPSTYVPF